MTVVTENEIIEQADQCRISDNFDAAKRILDEGIISFPESKQLMIKINNNNRSLRDFCGALDYSKKLKLEFPDFFDGYCRMAQDLMSLARHHEALAIIEEGVAKFPTNKWVNFTALLACMKVSRHKEALRFGDLLANTSMEFTNFHKPYFDALLICRQTQKAKAFLDKLPETPIKTEMYLSLLLSERLYDQYYFEITGHMYNNQKKARDYAEILSTTPALRSCKGGRKKRRPESVDVICIASDEAPYISDFIHHYLYLGFRNIFIGINNTSDATKLIVDKISKAYPNVFTVDVDSVINNFRQKGCYSYLFNHAKEVSFSEYCMFVDVDEFWIADPFPSTISEFLMGVNTFDCMSFPWINVFNEQPFSRPFSRENKIRLNHHVKSILRYESEYIAIRAHAPIVSNVPTPQIRLGIDINYNYSKTPTGYNVEQKANSSIMPKLGTEKLGWIFHRIERSEIEFAYKLFKVRANNNANKVSFKTNRKNGFTSSIENNQLQTHFLSRVFGKNAIEDYHESILSFEQECGVEEDIQRSRENVSESTIWEMLKNTPDLIFTRDRKVILNAFLGTRFHDYIKARCGGSHD